MPEPRAGETMADRTDGEHRLLRAGYGLTALIVVAFAAASVWKPIWQLQLNEIGDAVAGFASCLAFLWVVITIQLQIRELRFQRISLDAATEANRQQVEELAGTREATSSQLEIARVDHGVLLRDYAVRVENDAVEGLLGQFLFDLVPNLLMAPSIAQARPSLEESLAQARALLAGKRLSEALLAIGNCLHALSMTLGSDGKAAALSELERVDGLRERLDLGLTLVFSYYLAANAAGEAHRYQYDLGVHLVERGMRWLFDARDRFPTATEAFAKRAQELSRRMAERGLKPASG